ncbi:alpha beta-hydrolase [Fusarium avenaceum]|nr:alpha beta-hydrolase [Fusarium avenaceum]
MLKKAVSPIKKLFRKSHTSRQAAERALDVLANAAASGTTESKGNSAPATRNAAELVKKFDEVIAGLGSSDGEFPVDQTLMERLLDQAERLPQYKLPLDGADWSCDAETKSYIMLAAAASEAAYGRHPTDLSSLQEQTGLIPLSEEVFGNSYDGSIKQLAVSVYSPSQSLAGETHPKTLAIAIRGSVSFVDWITNFNGDPIESQFVSKPNQAPLNKAHTGLLRVAEKMQPKIRELVHKHLGDSTEDVDEGTAPKARIILTGHSAGGGVAALLYLHYTLNDAAFKGFDLRCITFAAPPVIEEANFEDVNEQNIGNFISIINEGDPVPRIERAYLLSLADLYGTQEVASNADDAVSSWKPPPTPQLHLPRLSSILTIHVLYEDEHVMESLEEETTLARMTSCGEIKSGAGRT